ncbi:MAG: tRNA lysidine(34) synthetase TilS [Trueperella sp.]|nr:tRNA lysidine(34) synthetase TilS [Trueperella sp.]
MAGPHPAVAAARHALTEIFTALGPGAQVLLAVSGGADSMALADTAAWVAPRCGIQLQAITVDHGIRPESRAEAETVCAWLTEMGIPAQVVSIELGEDGGPEGAARIARYRAIGELATKLSAAVLLGHNADDQAETVLLGLGRGSGARSIAGMSPAGKLPECPEVTMYRPLLGLRSAELRTVCQERAVPWVEDPSNMLDGPWRAADGSPLRRSALRHRVIPALEEALGPGVVPALARTAAMLQADNEVLSSLAEQVWETLVRVEERAGRSVVVISCAELGKHPQALRTRILYRAFEVGGAKTGQIVNWHVMAVDSVVTGRDNRLRIDLPGAIAWRDQNQLTIGAAELIQMEAK